MLKGEKSAVRTPESPKKSSKGKKKSKKPSEVPVIAPDTTKL
jgi:hypothetical protein